MPLPGLDKAEGRGAPEEEPAAETVDQLKATIGELQQGLAAAKQQAETDVAFWREKFKKCDAENQSLQTEIAQLKGR